MLVFGLRGGALPLGFARAGWHVRVVEPDTDAVAVSRRVAYKPGELPLDVADRACSCGGIAICTRDRVDAFGDSYMPYPLCTRECVEQLADHVPGDGLLVYVVEAHGWAIPARRARRHAAHAVRT